MKFKLPYGFVFISISLLLAVFQAFLSADVPSPDDSTDRLREGRDLFLREWRHGDKRSLAGDGLGPVYNARSCLECHYQEGIGGSGPKDVTIISAFIDKSAQQWAPGAGPLDVQRAGAAQQPSREELSEIHPDLKNNNSFVLHQFSDEREFDDWKSKHHRSHIAIARGKGKFANPIWVALIASSRNPPSLLGAGLIDRIPVADLKAIALEQEDVSERMPDSEWRKTGQLAIAWPKTGTPRQPLPIRGRVAFLEDGRVGRFGWKALVASLHEFVLQECACEIGLEVPGVPRSAPPWLKNYKAPGLDLTTDQCQRLTEFVGYLPRPIVRIPSVPAQISEIESGKELFKNLGCATCHRPTLGGVEGLYSDLLLHDMGQTLSAIGSNISSQEQARRKAAIAPMPILLQAKEDPRRERGHQFGAGPRDWRTPPLWGLRDSAPYLHDGRAATISDAILAHDGEGAAAAQAFENLTNGERKQLDRFLQSLVAPPMPW
jgi:CxxC motif-containing protein (DUF1111 family)